MYALSKRRLVCESFHIVFFVKRRVKSFTPRGALGIRFAISPSNKNTNTVPQGQWTNLEC